MSKYEPSSKFKEIGSSGLKRFDGYLDEEYLSELKGARAIKVWKKMRANPVVSGMIKAFTLSIRPVMWRVDPNPEGNEEDAKFVESCLNDMSSSWTDTISEHMEFPWNGFEYSEIVYKLRNGPSKEPSKRSKHNDGLIGWRKIAGRAPDTLIDNWDFDSTGGIQGVTQSAPPDYKDVYLPIEKCLLFRTSAARNNPEGESLLRGAYEPWYYAKELQKIEAISAERDGCGIPKLRVPAKILLEGASTIDKKILEHWQKVGKNLRTDEQAYLLIPSDRDDKGQFLYDVDLLTSAGSRSIDLNGPIMRYNKFIALSLLSDVLLLGLESVGSLALAREKNNWMALGITAMLDIIKETYNRHAIPRLLDLNGKDISHPPTLNHGGVKAVDLMIVGKFVVDMVNAGVIEPDEKMEEWVRKICGIPAPESDI